MATTEQPLSETEVLDKAVTRAQQMEESAMGTWESGDHIESRQIVLSNDMTLWQFIHDHFAEVNRLYMRLRDQAKRLWGNEGWRMVPFDGLGLCVAADQYKLVAKARPSGE